MSGKMPIFYSAFLLTGVNLLLRLVSAFFQVFVSGRIGAAGVGLLQLVMSVGVLAMTAGTAGIRTAAMYLTAEEIGRKKLHNIPRILQACFLYSLLCSSCVAVPLWVLAPDIAVYWIGDPRASDAIRLLAFFLPVSCLCGVMTGFFTAADRIGTLAAAEVEEQLCAMVAAVLFLSFYAGKDPGKACQAIVLGSGCGSCCILLTLVFLCRKEVLRPGPPIPIRKRLLQAAVPLALADDLKSGISTAENLMVPKRLALYDKTSDPLAAFGTVCGMVFPILMLPAAIIFGLAELLIPELARCRSAGSHARIRYLTRRSLRASLLYGCLCAGLLFLSADTLCLILYRSPEAGFFLRRFSLLAPMLYCDAITDSMTKGLGQQKACVRYNILTSSLDVCFLFFLLPQYGMNGYFFSFLLTHLLNFLLSLRRLLKITEEKLRGKEIIKILLAAALALRAAMCFGESAAAFAVYILTLFSLLTLMKILSREDWLWLRSLVKRK